MFSKVSVCPQGDVYASMQWAGAVSPHAMGKGGVYPGGVYLGGVPAYGGVSTNGDVSPGDVNASWTQRQTPPSEVKRAVRILLECILVFKQMCSLFIYALQHTVLCSVVHTGSSGFPGSFIRQ